MTYTPEYETKNIDLPKGIKIGGIIYKCATIREQTVGDIVHTAKKDDTVLQIIFKQTARRVVKLGTIDSPGETLIEKLSPADYDAIVEATNQMDDAEGENNKGKK